MTNELIIDKKTNFRKITNKENIEKLVLKCKVNPKKIKEFINVKELVIDYVQKDGTNYNEQNIDKLSFKNNLEKLIFRKFYKFGVIEKSVNGKFYSYDLPNLKSIEFPTYISSIYSGILGKSEKLEDISFRIYKYTNVYFHDNIDIFSKNLKKIIIKNENKDYEIIPDYLVKSIDDLDLDENKFEIDYSNHDNESSAKINLSNANINICNCWYVKEINNELYIPDYVTCLYGYGKGDIYTLSFNLKLLESIKRCEGFLNSFDKLHTVELRSKNEMSLIPNKRIYVKEYGVLNGIYIQDNLLYLDYDTCELIVDSNGNITRNERNTKNDEEKNELDLSKYTLEELESYLCYLKLLKLSEEEEYKKAMEVVEKILVKKYIKIK